MEEEGLKAYKGIIKQGALLLTSPKYGLVVVSTELPNLTVTLPFRIPVTTAEFRNLIHCSPESYKGRNFREPPKEYHQQDTSSSESSEVIIFRLA